MSTEREKNLERIRSLRYMDDDFFTICLDGDTKCTETIIRIILDKENIEVKSVQTQHKLKNLYGRSAILDVHAVDSNGLEYDIEIQRTDVEAGAKRACYNSSLMDAHMLDSGEDTESIPDVYVIFITENDVLGYGKSVYYIDRCFTVDDKPVPFGDGSHIVYVNGKYNGDDEIGRLMYDFSCEDPNQMYNKDLADKARYFKENEEGVRYMSKVFEDIRREATEEAKRVELRNARESAEKMIRGGKLTLDEIAEYIPILSISELKKIKARII